MDGGRVQPLRGWTAAGEYRSKSGLAVEPEELITGLAVEPEELITGLAVEPEELITGLPEVYGSAPAGRLPTA